MIPSINTWFYLDYKKPNLGDFVLACIDNSKLEIEGLPKFSVGMIVFHKNGFFPCFAVGNSNWRPLKEIIVWQPMPKPPHDLREKDPNNKAKYYSYGKFFDTLQEMMKFSVDWINMPFDYEEFCNQVQLMMSTVLSNQSIRGKDFINKEAYWHARRCLGWGKERENEEEYPKIS